MRFVSEMQHMYEGEYSETMKKRIFKEGGEKCRNVNGELFVSAEWASEIAEIILTPQQKVDIAYYKSIADVLPMKKAKEILR